MNARPHPARAARRAVAAAVAALVLLSGCSSAPDAEPDLHAHSDGIMHDVNSSAEAVEIEDWSPVLVSEAKIAAKRTATAYAQPGLADNDWYRGLEPHLSGTAKNIYKEISNINIQSTKVTKVEEPKQGKSPAIATVKVKTDATTLTMLMSRSDGQWFVEKITSDQ